MDRRKFIATGLATAAVAAMPAIPVAEYTTFSIDEKYIIFDEPAMGELLAWQEFMVRTIACAFNVPTYMLRTSLEKVGESEVHTVPCQDPADGTDGNNGNGKGE